MIGKKWWKALALSGSAATLSFLPIAISSCFEKEPEPTPEQTTITLPINEVTTIEHATQMSIFCTDKTVLELRVGIKSQTPNCLSLVSDTIQMIDGAGTIEYIISDAITNPTQILFDLDVAILNPVGRTEVTTFNKCCIVYANQIPDDDKIICSSFSIDYSNTHVESFNFTFYQEPKSDIKVAFSTHEPEGTLWIDSESYQVQKDPKPEVNLWYLTIPVHLNIRQYKSRAFAFDLELQFINSRGIKQTTKYTNLIVNFIEIDSEEVPLDYYEINSAGKILGIYDSISEQQMSGYTVMRFPEEAESIDGSAFDRVSHFGNIKKIIMPKGIKTIGVDAFSGCTNLFEMDLTDYGDRGPTWFTYGCPRMFVTENMKLKYGYLWTGGIIDKESWDVYPTSMGLPTGWNVFCANQVTPRELYDIDEATQSIKGISRGYEDLLWNYAVIRIPEGIKVINQGALDPFKSNKYYKNGRADQPHTRRVIFNHDLESTGERIFAGAGVSGPVYFPCKKDVKLGKSIFEDCLWCDTRFGEVVPVEPLVFEFDQCNEWHSLPELFVKSSTPSWEGQKFEFPELTFPHNIKTIGSEAFFFVHDMESIGGTPTTIKLPKGIESIGELAFCTWNITQLDLSECAWLRDIGVKAFSYHRLTSLTLNKTINTIGEYAFGISDTQEAHYSLSEIDISSYTQVPPWVSTPNIFANACNNGGGKIYINAAWTDEQKQQLTNAFGTLGIPSNWVLEAK